MHRWTKPFKEPNFQLKDGDCMMSPCPLSALLFIFPFCTYLHVCFKPNLQKHQLRIICGLPLSEPGVQQEAQFKRHAQIKALKDCIPVMLCWIRTSIWIKVYNVVLPIWSKQWLWKTVKFGERRLQCNMMRRKELISTRVPRWDGGAVVVLVNNCQDCLFYFVLINEIGSFSVCLWSTKHVIDNSNGFYTWYTWQGENFCIWFA